MDENNFEEKMKTVSTIATKNTKEFKNLGDLNKNLNR